MRFGAEHRNLLNEILRWRRDVRHFRSDPVGDDVLTRLREAMALAPSVGNARPWRVIRIEDPAIRAALRENFERSNAQAAQGYEGERRDAYARLKLSGLDKAPVLLAVFTVVDPAEGRRLGRSTMPETLRQSTAMAIYTLWLAARAENLGLGMVSILDPAPIGPLLGVPEDWEFSALLCIGHPEETDDMPLLHRVGWQENTETDWQTL